MGVVVGELSKQLVAGACDPGALQQGPPTIAWRVAEWSETPGPLSHEATGSSRGREQLLESIGRHVPGPWCDNRCPECLS